MSNTVHTLLKTILSKNGDASCCFSPFFILASLLLANGEFFFNYIGKFSVGMMLHAWISASLIIQSCKYYLLVVGILKKVFGYHPSRLNLHVYTFNNEIDRLSLSMESGWN